MSSQTSRIRLYGNPLSGHSHRVQLFLGVLDLPHELVNVDLAQREHKQPAFVQKSPFGQIPVLEDGEVTLYDSNAILIYLALQYDRARRWLPEAPLAQAQVQEWLSAAAGPLAAGPATARLVRLLGAPLDYDRATQLAQQVLGVVNQALASRQFLVGDHATLADLAIYTYVALAPEGGIELSPYSHIAGWLARVESLPGFVPMKRTVKNS